MSTGRYHRRIWRVLKAVSDEIRYGSDPAMLPAEKGAYVLDMELGSAISVPMAGGRSAHLAPGRYLYAGSARGSGGIRARIVRHARRIKKRHWHIDGLTARADIVRIYALPGGEEHAALRALVRLRGAEIPVPGFGASDCRACPAHLVRLPTLSD